VSPDFNTRPIQAGLLTPYTALVFFAGGLLASNIVVNTIFMHAGRVTYSDYFRGRPGLHLLGFLGGCIWMLALCMNVIASGVAGPAVSYALGQGATLVAAIWGVFIWREFMHAPQGTWTFVTLMFAGYVIGLVLIGMASV
jgi:glucose uptake protein